MLINVTKSELKTIIFNLPVSELAFANAKNEFVVESGKFKLAIDKFSKEITVK